jgi:signal transduction histidine kinase
MDGVHPRDDHHMASLLEETRRLGHLVDDLHTLALAETGRLVLQQEAVAFGILVDEVVGRHEAQARQRNVALRASIAPGLPKAWADPARVRQVLDNLLTNAIRHTPAGREVVVDVSTLLGPGFGDGPMVRCRVTDAGPGFREDQLGQVFERFKRAGDSQGSGLGLSIARDLVRAHGARSTPATIPSPAAPRSASPCPPDRASGQARRWAPNGTGFATRLSEHELRLPPAADSSAPSDEFCRPHRSSSGSPQERKG